MKITPLIFIGVYLIIDGIVSYLYFKDTATTLEQMFRIFRVGIGVYILWKRRRLK